jgi:hypothetical protein
MQEVQRNAGAGPRHAVGKSRGLGAHQWLWWWWWLGRWRVGRWLWRRLERRPRGLEAGHVLGNLPHQAGQPFQGQWRRRR